MLWAAWPSLAHAQPPRRVALLIGNAAYTGGMPALTYPLQDIQVLEQSLKRLNFEVQVVRNANSKAMGNAVKAFGTAAREAQVALVYYSGHGMQARDENYLIPIGATIESEGDLDIEAIQLKALMRQIEDARPKTTVVVLDACRDNPVASRTKSASKGLSRVQNPPNNTLVVFAALPGTTATDNGVFAKELASRIVEPNVGIRTVFDKVGQAVRQATGQKQAIQRDDQLSEDVVLVATARVEPVPEQRPGPAGPAALTAEQIEQQAWEAAQRANSAAVYNAYLAEYPRGRFASLARIALASLASVTGAATAPQPQTQPLNVSPPQATASPPSPAGRPIPPSIKDCAQCPELVVVPAGSFTMGSQSAEQALARAAGAPEAFVSRENPSRRVAVSAFAAGRYAITRGEFAAFVQAVGFKTEAELGDGCAGLSGAGVSKSPQFNWRNPGFVQEDDHPVVCVTWRDAQEYANWISHISGKTYRLLTEAEREYATRAGSQSAFWWGETIRPDQANYRSDTVFNGSPKGVWRQSTLPVASFAANPFGLFNVHGNVAEWVQDCSHVNYTDAPSTAAEWTAGCEGANRVVRGGSWYFNPAGLRSASRLAYPRQDRLAFVGFRLARSL